jgi:hypothetical protein
MKYTCECCNYFTEDKSNFNKHMASRKHKMIQSKVPKVDDLTKLIEMVRILNEKVENQEKQINEQKKQIEYINSEIF